VDHVCPHNDPFETFVDARYLHGVGRAMLAR
jgi:hypothetical protein